VLGRVTLELQVSLLGERQLARRELLVRLGQQLSRSEQHDHLVVEVADVAVLDERSEFPGADELQRLVVGRRHRPDFDLLGGVPPAHVPSAGRFGALVAL
jgi:hypothetical protein